MVEGSALKPEDLNRVRFQVGRAWTTKANYTGMSKVSNRGRFPNRGRPAPLHFCYQTCMHQTLNVRREADWVQFAA